MRKHRMLLWAIVAGCMAAGILQAKTLYWDPGLTPATPSGGAGTWDTNTVNWSDLTTDVRWTNNANAVFQGAPGVVSLIGTGTPASVSFQTDGYVLTNGWAPGNLLIVVSDGCTATVASSFTVAATGINKEGAGTMIWGGGWVPGQSQWKAQTLGAGTIKLARANPFDYQNNLVVSNGATFDLNGFGVNTNATIGNGPGNLNTITGRGTIINNGSANCSLGLCNNNNYSSFTFDGSIMDGTRKISLVIGRETMTLTGTNNTYSGDTTFIWNYGAGAGLRAGATNAFSPNSTIVVGDVDGEITNLDLNGYDQIVGGLSGESQSGPNLWRIFNNGAARATLTIRNNTVNQTCGGAKGAIMDGKGVLALVKDGTNTLTLTGTNTYSGGTLVRLGTLRANVNGALGTTNVTVSPTGTLYIATGVTNAINDNASLILQRSGTNYARAWLGTGTVESVRSLWLDGTQQTAGKTYGSSASAAQVVNTNYFQGPGMIKPLTGSPPVVTVVFFR